ncbi:hypothetical protein RIVERRIDER_8 [Xanthomonas phage RiverRider]|uniref:Uncharacterized protein n=1 Tax=Xanthomonas phage RiverRider TaxID=2108116 RepID=A0A2P1JUR4_9CAUD|nr:hypothetical protein HWB58_gp08 [Xanthomonas phage RiverRider]AVO23096.1 hypothetical protein RIVERRIDER_8 [Xanthomonas phage RiverRider]
MSAQISDFERTFGKKDATTEESKSTVTTSNDRQLKPKAQLWINVGYEVDSHDKDGNAVTEFISLPTGIPVDTMDKLPANQRDAYFQKKQQASNKLLDTVIAMGKTLQPGEEKVIGARGSLQIQVRRVKAEAEIVDEGQNSLIVDLVL